MPYKKIKLVNGLTAPMHYTERLTMPKDYTKALTMVDDMSWQNNLTTLNNVNWQNTLTTVKDLDYRNHSAFTGIKYVYEPPKNYQAPQSNVPVFDKDNDTQINSYFDAAAMSSNDNVEHSNIVTKGVDWLNTWLMSDQEKEFYEKYKKATGKDAWDMFMDVRAGEHISSYKKAYSQYQSLAGTDNDWLGNPKYGLANSEHMMIPYGQRPEVLGKLTEEQLQYFRAHPEEYNVPENATTIYEITDKYGDSLGLTSDMSFKVDENGEVQLKQDIQGFGGRYSDGSYEFENFGEYLFGTKFNKTTQRIEKGMKNATNDIVQVTVDTFKPMVVNPSWNSGKIVVNNLLVNLSETMDMFTFWKPLLQETVDQYEAIKEPSEKFNPVKFWNVLWNKTPGVRTAKLKALANYYGADVDEHGDLIGPNKKGRRHVDYKNVTEKLFNWNTNINVLAPVNDLLSMTGLILNGYARFFDPDSTFGTNWGQGKFEINAGDLALEMIDPSFLTSGITDTITATKTTKYIKANSRQIAEETVDAMFKGIDYKTFSYTDRLQMYDYMEKLISKNADKLGSATSKDFLRTLRNQEQAGNYFKTTSISDPSAINRNISKMMLDYQQKMGGYINPDLLQKQILDAQEAISSAVVRNNANTVTTSILGGLTDFGYLTQAGPLQATFLPAKLGASAGKYVAKIGTYPLVKGIKLLGEKLGIKNNLKIIEETLYQSVRTQFGLEVAKAKEYTNALKNINNIKVAENKYVSKKLQQIIKENAISFTAVERAYTDLGLSPDQVINLQSRLITEEVLPNVVDTLKSGKNPQEMLEDIMVTLKHCTDVDIVDIADFAQTLKDMQQELITKYNFTNFGTSALTSLNNSKYAYTGLENMIKLFEDLDKLFKALEIKDNARFMDIKPERIQWADAVIRESEWADWADLAGSSKKVNSFMWTLSESYNIADTGLIYKVDTSKKAFKTNISDLFGYKKYDSGKIGVYIDSINNIAAKTPEISELVKEINQEYSNLSYYIKQLVDTTDATKTIKRYELIEDQNIENALQHLRTQLTDIDEKGLYKINANNTKLAEQYPNLIKLVEYTPEEAVKNITNFVNKLQELQSLNLKIEQPSYTTFSSAKKVSVDLFKAIGIQANVLNYTDEQLEHLWGIINRQLPEAYRAEVGQYFLNANKATPELDVMPQIKTYNQEKIVKAWLSLVADNGNETATRYLKNIYNVTLDPNGTLRFTYDYISDIIQGLTEIQVYLNNGSALNKNLLEVTAIQHTKLENYATRQYLHEHNRGLQMLHQNSLISDFIKNIFNRDVPEYKALYEGFNVKDGDPIIDIAQDLYLIWQGDTNRKLIEQEIKLSGLDVEDQKALFTVLDNVYDTDFYDIALKDRNTNAPTAVEAWKQDIKDSFKQYRGYTALEYEKDNLISLLRKYDVTFAAQDIETTSGQAKKLAELIDKINFEKDPNYERKNIITMKILNTQPLYGQPIDIAFSLLDSDGNAVDLFNTKINLHSFSGHSESVVDSNQLADFYYPTYQKTRNHLDLYDKFKKDYSNPNAPEKDVRQVLTEAYQFLSSISISGKSIADGEIPIYGFANKNDILALRSACTNLHVPEEFNNLLDNIKFTDYLNEDYRPEHNKTFNVLPIQKEQKIDEILEHMYMRALETQKIGNTINRRVKMVEGLNTAAIMNMSKNITNPIAQAALLYADTDKGKYAISVLASTKNLFEVPTELNNEVRTALYDMLNKTLLDYANQTRNIDKVNSFFKQNFTDNAFLNNEEAVRMLSENLQIPIDQAYNSMTQLYHAAGTDRLMFSEQHYRNTIYSVLDAEKLKGLPNSSVVAVSEIAQHIVDEMNKVKNSKILEPYHNTINKIINEVKAKTEEAYKTQLLKNNTFAYLRTDHLNVKHSWATLVQMRNRLKDYLESTPKEINNWEFYNNLKSVIDNTDKDLTKLLEDSTEVYEKLLNWDGTTNLDKFKWNAYVDLPNHLKWQIDLEEVSKLDLSLESMLNCLNNLQSTKLNRVVSETINDVKTPLTELHNYLLEVKKMEPKKLAQTMHTVRQIKNFKEDLFTSKVLQLSDTDLIKYLIANVPDRFFIVNIPKTGKEGVTVNYGQIYQDFIKRKKEFKGIGINLQEHEDKLEVSLDYKMYKKLIKKNKDYQTKDVIKWTFNNEKVVPIQFPEITQDELNILYTITQDKETVDKMLELFKNFEELDPNLTGLTGDLHSEEFWETFKNTEFAQNLKAKDWINTRDKNDKGTLYNQWNLGTSGTRNSIYPTTPHELNILVGLANRLSGSHEEYAEFIDFFLTNESNIAFNSNVMKQMPLEEINKFLKENSDYRIAIPVKDKAFNRYKINGGIRLATISEVTKANRKALEDGGALILPYDTYSYLVNHINNFTYGHHATAIASKLLGKWKVKNIISTGAQIGNAIDTTLKSMGASGEVSQTMFNNLWASVQIANYKNICMQIKKATGVLDDRSIDMYFANQLPGTNRMTKEAFNIVDSYYRLKGEVIDSDVHFIDKILKPTIYAEEINRIGLYKTFMDQGYTSSQAWKQVMNNLFEYSTTSKTSAYMKFIFPYWTYLTNQIRWFLECFTEQPELARLIIKTYENHWEQDDRFRNEYAFNNGSVLYTKYAGDLLDKDSNMTLKIGPSLFDSLAMMSDPAGEISSKLSIPLQVLYNTIMEYVADEKIGKNPDGAAIKQYIRNHYATYDTKTKHTNTGIAWIDSLYNWIQDNKGSKGGGGSYSIQSMARGKYNLIEALTQMVPFLNGSLMRFDSAVRNFERSGKYEDLFMPSLFGAVTDSSSIKQYNPKEYAYPARTYSKYPKRVYPRKVYPKKTYAKKTYARKSYARKAYARKSYARNTYATTFTPGTPRVNQGLSYKYSKYGNGYAYYTGYPTRTYTSGKRPSSKYQTFMYNIQYPNHFHRPIAQSRSGNMQTIPQYLYSYMGKNRQGKLKGLSWLRMSPRYKVKNTLKRLASL